ncbi:hypothetical protein [Polaromonas sp.]|uniref:hypothetical protein n=1 Tax=Polaromonas sp. TaxID=1869339 RepID=UPI00352B613B
MKQPGMEIGKACAALKSIADGPHGRSRELRISVATLNPGAVGGSPKVGLVEVHAGIDWNAGHVIFTPAVPLTELSSDDVQAIHKSAKDGQSWHAYQSYKTQADRIRTLEAEIAALKAELTTKGTP